MYVRTVILKRPSQDIPWPSVPAEVTALIQDYRDRQLLLDRQLMFLDYFTVKDVTIWASEQDFINFWNEPAYVDFIKVAGEYNELHGVTTVRSATTIDSSNIVAS